VVVAQTALLAPLKCASRAVEPSDADDDVGGGVGRAEVELGAADQVHAVVLLGGPVFRYDRGGTAGRRRRRELGNPFAEELLID